MARRYYSSTAVATTLAASANNSTTSITVTALSGYPAQTPFTAIIDPDTASEEVVEVTNVSGTTLTVTRGVDGTTASSHNAGAVFRHGVSARDFDEANAFVNGGGISNALVNARGDLITATANDTPAILTAGSNGQMLMADSSATAGLRYVDPPANRNLIINGAMQVSQRGTSKTGITGFGYYTADRWTMDCANTGVFTQSIENDSPTGSGFVRSVKLLCTTADAAPAASDQVYFETRLEGQDLQRTRKGTAGAEPLTLSFWVKSNVTGTYIVALNDLDNSRYVSASYSVLQSGIWERKTITYPADTTGSFTNDNGLSLVLRFWLAAGSNFTSGTLATAWQTETNANTAVGQTNLAAATNNYWQITGVQLETGPVATPFEFEPYEATLRKCQRYYYLHASGDTKMLFTGAYNSNTSVAGAVYFPSAMRTTPSLVIAAGTDFYINTPNGDVFNSMTILWPTENAAFLFADTNVSGTGAQAAIVRTNNASASVAFSAEL